jgi:cation:H+ antiporter
MAAFIVGAAVSLLTSWLLVSRLERIGERLSLSEALLGIVAALAADAPEISAAISALSSHQQRIGAGVVLGSNVFNLAALLGLGAVVAGRIGLHRKVVVLSGAVALSVALVSVMAISDAIPPSAGLGLATAVIVAYLYVLGTRGQRLPAWWRGWLRSAVGEEELELEDAIRPSRGRWPDVIIAAVALSVVVIASVAMERAASSLGGRLGIPEIITGGLVLAAVTSLPNAVAAVYLASRGRGAATLSTALNSNTLNVVAGLLLPGTLLGLGQSSGQALLVTAWYAGLSLAVLSLAWRHQGLRRRDGSVIIAAYAAFTVSLIVSGYPTSGGSALIISLGVLSFLMLLAVMRPVAVKRAPDAPMDVSRNGHKPRNNPLPVKPVPARPSLIPQWHVRRLWAVSMIATAVIAAADAATGHRVVLIGLLIVGPCIVLITGKWLPTTVAGAWACGLAVVLGIPDGIWATTTHIAFITAVAVVAVAAAAASAVIGHARTSAWHG